MKFAPFIAAVALLGAAPLLAHPDHKPQPTQAGDPNKVVCKRAVETGSLVKGSRTCKTRAAWDQDGAAARKQVQEMQDNALINSHAPS